MATITVQNMATSGLELTTEAAAAGGDAFVNNGRTFLYVSDTGTTAPTVTIDSPVECSQGSTHDVAVAITAGEARYIGPFPPSRFNDETGKVTFTYSSETDVVIAAVSL